MKRIVYLRKRDRTKNIMLHQNFRFVEQGIIEKDKEPLTCYSTGTNNVPWIALLAVLLL